MRTSSYHTIQYVFAKYFGGHDHVLYNNLIDIRSDSMIHMDFFVFVFLFRFLDSIRTLLWSSTRLRVLYLGTSQNSCRVNRKTNNRLLSFLPFHCYNYGHPSRVRKQVFIAILDYELCSYFTYFCSNDIGVFGTLTNAYCITAIGGSENFYR